jgi:DNA-binding LacI/PurR family transcriptional regulator
MSDRLAQGVIDAARARELRVPEQLAVVGFDDAPAAASLGLTTIRQPQRHKGELAAHALLAMIDGAAARTEPPLETELVVRASTAPPAFT